MQLTRLFSLKPEPNEIGIEVEVEFVSAYNIPRIMGWVKHNDGSLRGANIEFVMRSPQARKDVNRYINYLKNSLERNSISIADSDRTGVHIHLNVQDWEIHSILNFMILYLMLEIPLVKWCGENRSGNMFCLRSIDASHLVLSLNDVYEKSDIRFITTDSYRYSSINPAALRKYGSLEFRAMRTPVDLSRINTWIKLLLKVKDASLSFGSTSDMIDGLSQNGIRPFIRSIFGYSLYRELTYNYDGDVDEDVLTSVRLIQPIAYQEYVDASKKRSVKPDDLVEVAGNRNGMTLGDFVRNMNTAQVPPAPPTRIPTTADLRHRSGATTEFVASRTDSIAGDADNPFLRALQESRFAFQENMHALTDEEDDEEDDNDEEEDF